ncbi:helix-turn-helix domain-containing protein [Herbaspirillum huttiense F1]|uniref:helix-turn-helix domain-containing protein n=1 Tax=Herbaspirillum huttiense TaxID=863372 RepID=UPI002884B04E|nr:helix-turn-helix domain-containing protein [Herbaspirillum huttiense]MDT0355664.1 helix-turn-helix domain-containing protein [Herbaspirillum huttiense F1]
MSIEAMQWAFQQDIKPASMKFVLVSLGDNAQHDGMAWPSIAALCEKTGLDRKTVISALNRLEQAGFLSDSGKRTGSTGQVKVYRFNFDRLKGAENGTVPKTEQFRNSRQRVPKTTGNSTVFPSKSTENGTRNPQEPEEPSGNPQGAPAAPATDPVWKPLQALTAAGVEKQTAKDWLALRKAKKAPVTETVFHLAAEAAQQAGVTLQKALEICCVRGWTGYKAEWIKKHLAEEGAGTGGAWFATEQGVIAKAAELGLKTIPGESAFSLKQRVQEAIDNGGKPPMTVSGQRVVQAQPKDEGKAEVSPENRNAALQAARGLKKKVS